MSKFEIRLADPQDVITAEAPIAGSAKGGNLVFRAGLAPFMDCHDEGEHGSIIFSLPEGNEALRIDPDGKFYINEIRVTSVDAEDVYHALSAWLAVAMPPHK